MRNVPDRTATVRITKEDCSSLDDAWVKIRTSIRLRDFLIGNDMEALTGFLAKIIVDWGGFDMDYSPDALPELTVEEATIISRKAGEVIRDPRKGTSAATP